jgi:hypothetical protein
VTVSTPPSNLIAQDTIKACGDSVLVSATSGLATYSWSNGDTTASLFAKSTGWYKITATNSSGCTGTDSVFVSIVKANIQNNDTAICAGQSVKLSADSILAGAQFAQCAPLPSNLQNGLVGYWPFCGNANDMSGNGNHGTIQGTIQSTTDRHGNTNSAYLWTSPNFNSNDYINIGNLNSKLSNKISISVWVLMNCSLSNQRIISTGEQGIIINQTQGWNTQIWPEVYFVEEFIKASLTKETLTKTNIFNNPKSDTTLASPNALFFPFYTLKRIIFILSLFSNLIFRKNSYFQHIIHNI